MATMESKEFTSMLRDGFLLLHPACLSECHQADHCGSSRREFWVRTFLQKAEMPVNTPLLPKAVGVIKKCKGNIRAEASGTFFWLSAYFN